MSVPENRGRLPRRTRWLLLALIVVAAAAYAWRERSETRRAADAMAREVALYRSEKRPDLVLGYDQWATIRDEADLASRLASFKPDCRADWTQLPGAQRSCAVDLRSLNGVPTMYVNFTFSDRALMRVSTIIPGEFHAQGLEHLVRTFGEPTVRQARRKAGIRLNGWLMQDGSALFYNRDPAAVQGGVNSIQWLPANGCEGRPCLTTS